MTSSTDEPSQIAVAAAAEHFIRALRMAEDVAQTARLETTLLAAPDLCLFSADRTLARLWPGDAAPRQEVIWSLLEGDRSWMKVAAFDAGGRVLLCQTYLVSSLPEGEDHV
jgi:hypothetical protein